jgi:hypothetical protein
MSFDLEGVVLEVIVVAIATSPDETTHAAK